MTELLVKDFIGKKGKKGDIAFEIEVEPKDAGNLPNVEGWDAKADHSLRNGGLEYTMRGPSVITEVPKVLESLTTTLSKYSLIENSSRASVHAHRNVLYYSPIQYWVSVCSYWLTEELLFDFCGDYRKGNSFCLRLSDAEGVLHYAHEDLRKELPFLSLHNDNIRYAGQNLKATWQFGSLEYRGMKFTLDKKKLGLWANALYDLGLNSKDFASPARLMDEYFMSDGSKEFLTKIYNKEFVELITSQRDWQDKLKANEGSLCELAYVHNWDAWRDRITEAYKDKGGVKRNENNDPFAPQPGAIRWDMEGDNI